MTTLEKIKSPLVEELSQYEAYMRSALSSAEKNINDVLSYVLLNRGKGLRPVLVLLMARIYAGDKVLGERSMLAAMLVELVHNASLIHDDVVDDSAMRHGKKSLMGLYGSHIAIVIGDMILATAFLTSMKAGHYDLNTYIVEAVNRLCEGELLQDEQSRSLGMTREAYYDIICRKTASLFAISAGAGAMSVNASQEQVETAWQVGYNLGMAFQIKDDILDFAPESQTGKPSCGDLREQKITLPLLMVMEQSSEKERAEIISLVREAADGNDERGEAAVVRLREIIGREGGMEAAEQIMNGFIDAAHVLVVQYPDSPYKESLKLLCDYIGGRNH